MTCLIKQIFILSKIVLSLFLFLPQGWCDSCASSTDQESNLPPVSNAYVSKHAGWDGRDVLRYAYDLALSPTRPTRAEPNALDFLETAKHFSKMNTEQIAQFYATEIVRLKAKYKDDVWHSYDIELLSVSLAHLIARGNYDVKKWIEINRSRSKMGQIWERAFKLIGIGPRYQAFFHSTRARLLWEKWSSLTRSQKNARWNQIKDDANLIAADLPPEAYFELNGIIFPEQTFGEVLGDLLRLNPPAGSFQIEELGPHPGGDEYPILQDLKVVHDINSVEYRPGNESKSIEQNGRSLLWMLYATNLIPKLVQEQFYDVANGASLHLHTSYPGMPWVFADAEAYHRRLCEIRQIVYLLARSLQSIHDKSAERTWAVMEIYSTSTGPHTTQTQKLFGHFQIKTLFTHPLLQWELQTDWAMMPKRDWEQTVTRIVQALIIRDPELDIKIRASLTSRDWW